MAPAVRLASACVCVCVGGGGDQLDAEHEVVGLVIELLKDDLSVLGKLGYPGRGVWHIRLHVKPRPLTLEEAASHRALTPGVRRL